MAAELQPPPPEVPPPPGATTSSATENIPPAATTPLTESTVPPPAETAGAPVPPKRHRRPSVRLGEIGNQTATPSYESNIRRTKDPWRYPNPSSKPSKTRPLTNLANGEHFDGEIRTQNGDGKLGFFNRRAKAKRGPTKRPRSNWVSSRPDGEDGFGEFGPDSDSPAKDHSPVHSSGNAAPDFWPGPVELDSFPESGSRDRKGGAGDGVRSWLVELGLSRYAPVFEIHEVDEEILPMLTLEDLKDMGINAVGSRRKLYSAIQKLGKGYT